MTIRKYTVADEPAVIALWNTCLTSDLIDKNIFYRRVICDINFDPDLFLLAEEDAKLLGFIYGTKCRYPDEMADLRTDQAWVVAMGVHPDHRRKGIGTALLTSLETALTGQEVKTIDLGPYPLNYFFQGVDQVAYSDAVTFFKKHGYNENSFSVAMDIPLRGYLTPEKTVAKRAKLEKEGYVFRHFRPRDSLPAFTFLRENFPSWMQNVRDSILSGRARDALILALNPDGEVVGFVMRAMDGTEERFGPFGVHQSLQGTGVGGVLFHAILSDTVAKRIFYTYFMWADGRNIDIYSAWGMKTFRTFSMMQKSEVT